MPRMLKSYLIEKGFYFLQIMSNAAWLEMLDIMLHVKVKEAL